MTQPDDQLIIPCGHCGVLILTWWAPNGGLLRGEYILAGNVIFHPKCFDDHFKSFFDEMPEQMNGVE